MVDSIHFVVLNPAMVAPGPGAKSICLLNVRSSFPLLGTIVLLVSGRTTQASRYLVNLLLCVAYYEFKHRLESLS